MVPANNDYGVAVLHIYNSIINICVCCRNIHGDAVKRFWRRYAGVAGRSRGYGKLNFYTRYTRLRSRENRFSFTLYFIIFEKSFLILYRTLLRTRVRRCSGGQNPDSGFENPEFYLNMNFGF